MSTLFVDVDDTLILFEGDGVHPYGFYAGQYWPNEALIRRMRAWDGPIVVWSGGGEEYARTVGEVVLGDLHFTALQKDERTFALVQPGDVVVDNDPISVRTHEPTEAFSETSDL